MNKKKGWFIVIGICLILFIINYDFLDSLVEKGLSDSETGIVERVIDGDTIEVGNNTVRLLGINSPEKGEIGYNEAKAFLEEKILGKEVKLIFGIEKYDKYYRELAYVYLGKENFCLESVREGYSNIYFPTEESRSSKEFNLFNSAWTDCLEKEKGLCEKSKNKCANCIKVSDLNLKTQEIKIKNFCSFNCDISKWSVKDEGRKKYIFGNKILSGKAEIILDSEDFKEDYVWTSSGDSFFIRDSFDKLVSWGTY